MFAIIQAGGKQYSVSKGDTIQVNKIEGNAGDKMNLAEVLFVGGDKPKFGAPFVSGASVAVEVVEQGRGEKIIVFKKKRRQNYRRKNGHKQHLTTLKISDITLG